jgi:hypothetical protein
MAYESLEPFGYWGDWLRTGQLAAIAANPYRAKDARPFRPRDFMPRDPVDEDEPEPEPERPAWEGMLAKARMITAVMQNAEQQRDTPHG